MAQSSKEYYDTELVASSNPTGGALVVLPGMLFPKSRGNKAAANLRLFRFEPYRTAGLSCRGNLVNFFSDLAGAFASKILFLMREANNPKKKKWNPCSVS